MTLFGRLLQFRAPEPEQESRVFDPSDRIRESFVRTADHCVTCRRPLHEHGDPSGRCQPVIWRPLGRVA